MFIKYEKRWNIIDTDFVDDTEWFGFTWIALPVIKCYEQRKLNVPANLALMFKNHYNELDRLNAVKNTKAGYSEYAKYADDVDKYLMLM